MTEGPGRQRFLIKVLSSFLLEKMMIKNAAIPASRSNVPPSGSNSETKKIRKATSGLSKLAPVIRPPQGETIETAEIAPRVLRSLGPVRSMKVAKSGKMGKKTPVIIKKAAATASLTSPVGVKLTSSEPKAVQSTSGGPGPLRGQERLAPQVTPPRKGSSRDLRSFISITNPERSLISAQNLPFLRRFVTEQGKILSRRLTRVTARQQREITKAIKQARILGYLQFVNTK
jgi:small subunit ribosomal protein S18